MHQQNADRLQDYFISRGIVAALIANPWTITWLTGYAPPIQTGPSPFEGSPAVAWWCSGELTLITSDAEAAAARASGANTSDYVGYAFEEPGVVTARQTAAVHNVLMASRLKSGKVAVDLDFLTGSLLATVQETLANASLEPLDHGLVGLRAVKTPDEIAKIKAALALCDLAQAEVRANLRPGMSEIEVWGQVKARLEREAGARLPIAGDLVAGQRTSEMGGLPGPSVVHEHDPVMVDVVPRLDGYWGDNCCVHFAGLPTVEMAQIYRIVRNVLGRAIEAVRPGLPARDLDALVRGAIKSAGYEPHPHHSGHGIGASYHEEPRIVPYQALPLAPGMVIALEPGIYLPGVGGVRLEDVVLVAKDGCELLTRHLLAQPPV